MKSNVTRTRQNEVCGTGNDFKPKSFRIPHSASRNSFGYTLLELIIVLAILTLLAGAAFPITRHSVKRTKEAELKDNLRMLRQAIDKYNQFCNANGIPPLERKEGDMCYPPTLEILVEGVTPPNMTQKVRFLPRIPRDPMTGKAEWGLRSMQDESDASSWGGENVYDVYSKSEGKALNGQKYSEW